MLLAAQLLGARGRLKFKHALCFQLNSIWMLNTQKRGVQLPNVRFQRQTGPGFGSGNRFAFPASPGFEIWGGFGPELWTYAAL